MARIVERIDGVMKTLKIKGYEAYTNSDLTEGRGRPVHIAYFTHEEDAKKATRGRGVMGTDAHYQAVNKTINVYDSYAEYTSTCDEQLRKAVLSKLTKDEKRVLGLL